MSKRLLGTVLALALVAGVFSALPAKAATTVPPDPNIVDPRGDGNYVNDQGRVLAVGGTPVVPEFGDQTGPVTVGAGDILNVWFSHTAETLTAYVQTVSAPPGLQGQSAIIYRVHVNPEGDVFETGCQWIQGVVGGPSNGGASLATYREVCAEDKTYEGGTIAVETLEDGTGVTAITIPRDVHPSLADGATLSSPRATSRHVIGTPAGARTAPQIDNTKPGKDYVLTAGGSVEPPPDEDPPGKKDPPGKGKKKGCKKGKGKKKGSCPPPPPPPPPGCAPYTPGEQGAEAPSVVVTDAATAEKPIEIELETGPGAEVETTHVFHNVQVDSAAPETGLYTKIAFDLPRDYDLYINYADGKMAARSAGYGPVVNDDDAGGQSGAGTEQVDGLKTADCGGYTIDVESFITEGGTITLTLWLGEVKYSSPGQAIYDAALSFL